MGRSGDWTVRAGIRLALYSLPPPQNRTISHNTRDRDPDGKYVRKIGPTMDVKESQKLSQDLRLPGREVNNPAILIERW